MKQKGRSSQRGWEAVPLRVIADVQLGKMLSAKARGGRGARPYLRNINVRWHHIDTSDMLEMSFDAREVEKYRLVEGDVLVCEGGEPGRAAVWKDQMEGALYQKALHRVRFRGAVLDPALFVYQLELAAALGTLSSRFTGSTIKHLPREVFIEWVVLVPPRAEQRRILAALEEHLSDLDGAVAALKRAKANADRYRRAVLRSALADRRDPVVRLEDVMDSLRNGISIRPEGDVGLRILRISAVRPMRVDLRDARFLPGPGDAYRDFLLADGDLLFTRYNGNPELVGACGMVRALAEPTVYPDKLIRVRVRPEKLNPRFAQIALSTGESREFIRARVKTTAGQAGIAGGDLKKVPLLLPILEEQQRIVALVEQRLTAVNQMTAEIDIQLARAAHLRRSILTRAFAGKLVPQDPSDEPASVLLDRIRASSETSPTPTRRRRSASSRS